MKKTVAITIVSFLLFVGAIITFVGMVLIPAIVGPDLPDGIEIAKATSHSHALVSRDKNYRFSGRRNAVSSNVIIAPYVEWVEMENGYIYGYNRNSPQSGANGISPPGYFLIHYSAGEIYYLDRKQLDSVLGGAAPQKNGLVPDVLFE